MKKIGFRTAGILAILLFFLLSFKAYSQDAQEPLNQIAQMLKSNTDAENGLIFGYSVWGLFGAFIFSMAGLLAFRYGRKQSAIAPIIIGIALMLYPYFFSSTLAIYLVGVALVGLLFVFR
ncbi:MAG: hypothetical protein ABIE74_00970 [Pseudomonadota bacterium]